MGGGGEFAAAGRTNSTLREDEEELVPTGPPSVPHRQQWHPLHAHTPKPPVRGRVPPPPPPDLTRLILALVTLTVPLSDGWQLRAAAGGRRTGGGGGGGLS